VYTTPEFWNDPHISAQMLQAHLNPDNAAASRTAEFINRSVRWLKTALNIQPDSRILDLGCGPGLYADALAQLGAVVEGIDVSQRSINYARTRAKAAGLSATFHVGNYLADDLGDGYDAAILIYEDYSVLSPEQRHLLLTRVWDALRPGGVFVFDVTAASRFDTVSESAFEQPNLMGGFWAPGEYDGIAETIKYPDLRLVLEKYTTQPMKKSASSITGCNA